MSLSSSRDIESSRTLQSSQLRVGTASFVLRRLSRSGAPQSSSFSCLECELARRLSSSLSSVNFFCSRSSPCVTYFPRCCAARLWRRVNTHITRCSRTVVVAQTKGKRTFCPAECFFASRCSSQCSLGIGITLLIIIGKSGEIA